MRRLLIAIVLVLVAVPDASGQRRSSRSKADEVDYLQLAAILAADGEYDRASQTLDQVDTSREGLDLSRYHLVRGIIRLNRNLYPQAAEDFGAAIAEAQRQKEQDPEAAGPQPVLFVYLGQAQFYAGAYQAALEAMNQGGAKADEIPSTFALRAEASWKLERKEDAWGYLQAGMKAHPEYAELRRRMVFYAIRLKLYRHAADIGTLYLEQTNAEASDYIAIGTALARSGSREQALRFIELAQLRNPNDARVALELARTYKELDQTRTAASLYERAALRGTAPAYIDAAELYRQAGDPLRALALNRSIVDTAAKLRQRLAILLDLRDFESVTAMARDLERARLLEDEPIRYALAYCHYKVGDFDKSEALLTGLSDPGLFRKAAELRQSMERCQDERWNC